MRNQKGFTLIEMVIVLAIISILGAAAYPRIAGYMETQQEQYRDNQEYVINKALKQYYAFTGTYPGISNPVVTYDVTDGEIIDEDVLFEELREITGVRIDVGTYRYKYTLNGTNANRDRIIVERQ